MLEARRNVAKDMISLFFISFSVIVYEVFLPRFFSVILDYSYVFVAVSLATLGVGLGAYLAIRFVHRFASLINWIMGIYALSIIAVTHIIYLLTYKGILFYSILAFIPFLLSGWLVSGIIQQRKQEVSRYYFADLLGAGLGAAGAILLMNAINPIRTIGLLSLMIFFNYYVLSFRQSSFPVKMLNSLVLIFLGYNFYSPVVDKFEFKAYRTSPNASFYEEPSAKIIYSQWDAFTRTDVYDADDEDLLYITIDGGAVSPISKFSGDLKEADYLTSTTSYLAFQGKPRGRVLIIGAGGGQEVLAAQMAGYSSIEAVDINKASFQAVQRTAVFSGDIYNKPNVKAISSDGRNYIRQTDHMYDLIYLSLVTKKSENGLGLALTENFIYTQEAVKEYLQKLTVQGRLAFLLHDDKELYKILFAAIKVLKDQGVPDKEIQNHVAIIGTYQHLGHVVMGMNGSKITRPLILIQNKPFSRAAAEDLFTSARQIQQIPIHVPYIYDQFQSLKTMMQSDQVNVSANRDDIPFFYHTSRKLPWSLMIGLIITVLFASFMIKKIELTSGQALYFSGLAVGFMLIEVTLVQKLILPLGHPTVSFVLVLGVLLVAGGIGSLFSAKKVFEARRYLPLLLVGIITIGVNFIIGWMNGGPYVLTETTRMLLLGLILAPLGFFMGMPFPYGLQKVGHNQLVGSWGLNGIMTVAGSILAAILSLNYGFTTTLLLGAMIYAVLFSIQPKLKIG